MADAKISALTAASALTGVEVFPVVQMTTKKATIAQALTYMETVFDPRYASIVHTSGRYYRAPNCTVTTTSASGVGTLRAARKFIPNAITIDRLGAEITIIGDVGSHLRLGIYNDDGTGRPSSLLLDAGTILGDSATSQEITISQALARGWYWFASVVQDVTITQPTIRAVSAILEDTSIDTFAKPSGVLPCQGFSMTGVTAGLPAFVPTAFSNTMAATYFRVA